MLSFLLPVLLWLVTAWRARAAWRDPSKRPLWNAFWSLAVAMTLRADPVSHHLDAGLGVNNLSALGKHLCGLVAAHAVLTFVHDVAYEKANVRTFRLNAGVPVLVAALLIVLFFTTPQPSEAADLLTDYATSWQITAYGIAWTSYLGTALVSACGLCWKWGRQPGSGLTGVGLRVVCAGTGVGVCYAVHRALFLLLRFAGKDPLRAKADEALSNALLYLALLLIIIGSSLPAARRLRTWALAHRDLLLLYPLWFELTEAAPTVRLDAPRSRVADAVDPRHTHERLYRRTIEIRDAALVLSDHASTALRAEAHAHATAHGLVGAEAAVTAEACWLRRAQAARLRGDPPSGEHRPPASGGRDLTSEIRALRQLASAYRSELAVTFSTAPVSDASRKTT